VPVTVTARPKGWLSVTGIVLSNLTWSSDVYPHLSVLCWGWPRVRGVLPNVEKTVSKPHIKRRSRFPMNCRATGEETKKERKRKNIWRWVKVMEFLRIHFSPVLDHFILLRSKYSPQHPVFTHNFNFSPNVREIFSHSYKPTGKIAVYIYIYI
jgi:hypothetical protein